MSKTYKDYRYYQDDDSKDFDDDFTEEDYERKEYYRNGWNESIYERQRF